MFREIKRRSGRNILLIIAVVISTALLIAMLSIADALLDYSYKTVRESREDIAIAGKGSHGIRNGHKLMEDISNLSGVEYTHASLSYIVSVEIKGKNAIAFAEGVYPKTAWEFIPASEKKRFDGWFEIEDDPHYSNNYTGPWTNEIIISSSLAKDFHISKGDVVNVSLSSGGEKQSFTVKGIFNAEVSGTGVLSGIYFIIIHLSELQSITGLDVIRMDNESYIIDAVDRVSISLLLTIRKDREKLVEYVKIIEEMYPEYKGRVLTKEDEATKVYNEIAIAEAFFYSVGLVSLLIGTLFVACVIVMSVFERTNEIGMMRAIGISKMTIFIWIFREAFFILISGAILGIAPGYIGAKLLSDYFSASYGLGIPLMLFTPETVLKSIVLIILIGGVVCSLPAWISTKMNILKAMRYMG